MPFAAAATLVCLAASPAPSPPARVEIPGHDGFKLRAIYGAPGREGPGVLLFHQCNRQGEATGYEGLLTRLVGEGSHVLVPDLRGFGHSRDGRHRNFHEQMEEIEAHFGADAEAFFSFLASRPGVRRDRLAVVGASCGAGLAIRLARSHPEVRALAFLSGSFVDEPELASAYETVAAARPVLAVYSVDDRYRTPESMRLAFERARDPESRLITYKGRAHGTPLFAEDPGLEAYVASWVKGRLLGGEGSGRP